MGDVRSMQRKSQEAHADDQAFAHARNMAGDVTELFDVLAGKLRPGHKNSGGGEGRVGTSLSRTSILNAQYRGSSDNTVLGMANLKRIQNFLDEPQKHLGQVIADIEKEAGSFYDQVSSRQQGSGAGKQRMQRGAPQSPGATPAQAISLEDVPEMNKYLGPSSRFGDGDGSFWDRWLTTTGHFTEQGSYAKADMPTRSMYSTGVVPPHSGFKRYQLDKLAFTKHPEPRVLTYAARWELGDSIKSDEAPKRLRGGYSESTLGPDRRNWLDEVVLAKAAEEFMSQTNKKLARQQSAHRSSDEHEIPTPGDEHSSTTSRAQDVGIRLEGTKRPVVGLRSIGAAGKDEDLGDRSADGDTDNEKRSGPGDESRLISRDTCLEDAVAKFGLVHPNYFGRRARTHVYNYYKQVSRRRHQYGDLQAMSMIPLTPLDHMGALPAYQAGLDAINIEDTEQALHEKAARTNIDINSDKPDKTTPHKLPPLATTAAAGWQSEPGDNGSGVDEGDEHERKMSKDLENDDRQMTSRTKYLVRCMERNVAPRAHVIIRKTHTTKVNLAHQGMGDVMGGILADCLVELPLTRELNLRDNMLTDKGLRPLVKAIKQRHDLYALDLSENKLDRWAARELAFYFSDSRCTLAKFILSKADVDDFEASNFVKHMKANKTLTYLDLSHNLIGSQETINYVRPEFYTGAEALADWVSTGSCPLKYLDVSWNTIRLDSAVYFGNAVAYATDLETLDLSFNCFGAKGGEAIGASLHLNTSLKTLRLASNAINPRACFVICEGLMQNSNTREIDLSNNPLGKIGVGCVMELPAEVGDRINTELASCNFMVDCEECWFDDEQIRPSYHLRMDEPYDRAVAFHLVRRAARDEGLKLKMVAHTMAGEAEKEIQLVTGTGMTSRQDTAITIPTQDFADKSTRQAIFRKYDECATGSLESEELGRALEELGLGGEEQVDMCMTRHDDGSGRIDESAFHEFIEESILQSKRGEGRSKAFLAEESNRTKPWIVPPEGQLRLEFEYQRLHNQGYLTSLESTDGLLAMLSGIGDGLADVMTHALNFVSLSIHQGMRMYRTVCAHVGGDKFKALAKVIPRMESPSDARMLKTTVLRDLDERRRLRHELGPAYRPLMGTPMGHYELDLSKPMHQLAARKILECNNMEKLARQTGPLSVFDASQKGDWNNTRNETVNGKPYRLKGTILDALPQAGTLEIDYVSTSRPPFRSDQGAQAGRTRCMSTTTFCYMLKKVGLGDEEAWTGGDAADVVDEEGSPEAGDEKASVPVERGHVIDEAVRNSPPRPRTRKMFEYLHFLMTGEGQPMGNKTIPTRPSAVDKIAHGAVSKQVLPTRRQSVLPAPARRQSILPPRPESIVPSRRISTVSPTKDSTQAHHDGPNERVISRTGKGRNATGTKSNSSRSATGPSLTGMDLQATIGINTVACRLDELMADKWFSIDQQCRFVLLAVKEAYEGDDFLQDVLVDFVVSVYPRIVDVYDYMTLVGCLEDLAQAFVIKRVGWLAAWNPCRPEGYMELSLDIREERQVAKMLIHMVFDQQGELWPSSSFRWSMYDTPIPGWMLPVVWNTEEGLPHKGVLTCTHACKAAGLRFNWILRTALAQVVSLSEAPPVSALIVGREDHSRTTGGEGTKSDQNPIITDATEGTDQIGEDEPENVGIAGSRLDDLYGKFDREFVDSLCKQAGCDFFLYGAHERSD
ncbi:unnamed protein product [Ectocarpus sp. 6 AP-2014]